MEVTALEIPDIKLIKPKFFGDARGFFFESYHERRYREHGVGEAFLQDNFSQSSKGVLRGLHIQDPHGQGKLVQVLHGAVLDVAVDVRLGSPSFGRHIARELSGDNRYQLYIPPGFAHGFVVLSDSALFHYKCTDYYNPEHEFAVRWDDPALGIAWGVNAPTVSDKDRGAKTLGELREMGRLPKYRG